jgi:hypothetical protein
MAVVLLEGSGDSGPEFELAVPVQLLDLARQIKEISKGLPLSVSAPNTSGFFLHDVCLGFGRYFRWPQYLLPVARILSAVPFLPAHRVGFSPSLASP